jgi:enoyl-CoA hydratase/carnithine racemase
MADGAAGNRGLSGAANRLARQSRISEDINIRRDIQQQRVVASNDGQHREIAMTYQHILYDVSEKIATITLHRPDRMNAWTPIMERDVRRAMEAAAADDNVRVIVLTGSGRAFCAGADMDGLKGLDPNDVRRAESVPAFDMNRRPDWQARYAYYPSIPKPVIGMLNGAAAGIGLVHALYCDLRFAADNTVFTTAFSRRGLIAEHGISWMLPRIVGHANALDLLMSSRRVYSDEALRIGLVNRLYPPDQLREQTYAYARDLADFVSPSAIAVIKRQLYDVPFQTLAEATIDANREMVVALRGSDFREGVASFMEKRPPRFTGK